MTTGRSSTIRAMAELVVPKSIPNSSVWLGMCALT
jgi:hypothetical protein